MRSGRRWRAGRRLSRAAHATALVLVLGCTSTSTPSPSGSAAVPPATVMTSPPAPSVASAVPPSMGSPSPGVSGSPASGSPGPTLGSPGIPESPGPALTPDPAFSLPDWEPWPAQNPGAPSVIVDHGPNQPVIALTIDDGNFPEGCRQEFAYLSANHIAATFFPTWVGAHKDRDLWRQIAAAGYPIGDHTLTHLALAGPGVEDHSVRRQLALAKERLESIIGRSTLPVWRPPYGAYDARSLRIAGELGLHTTILWSASDADTASNSQPEGMIRAALRAQPGDILLTHCNSQTSADILPGIVQGLLAKGYTFVTIPDLLRPFGLGG